MLAYETEQEYTHELNERLRMETGWKDVSSGLRGILWGYLVFFLGTLIGVGLVVYSAYGWLLGPGARPGRLPPLSTIWQFYIGLGILSTVGTFGYLMVVGGQWKCLHGAPERYGARWLMFFCLVCLLAGPALNIASYIGCVQRYPELSRGAASLRQIRFTASGHYMQLASAAASLLYSLFFLLFLRAVAHCHNAPRYVMVVNFALALVGGMVGLSAYMGYLSFRGMVSEDGMLQICTSLGWVICFIFYLCLIGGIRSCINKSVARVCSPLEMH